ncbi:heterokaryon incompatibility protein-domain-containing protein [Aspergillus filifer]
MASTKGGKSNYQYSALSKEHPHIRLVTLDPGSWSDEINCTMHVVPFDGQPVYEALSYVWGNSRVRKRICLNDHDFEVTENLWLAMRRLRNTSTPRVIWIDAICINQEDDDEKSQQVAMMGEIYKGCMGCIIWLGESSENAEEGVQSVTAAQAFELLGILATGKHLPELPCFSAVEDQRMNISERYEAHFNALEQLLNLPWWRRIWVIQELVLPGSVKFIYASEELAYQTLREVIEVLKTHAATCCKLHRMTLRAQAFDPLLTIQEQVDPIVSTRETWAKKPMTLFQLRRQFYAFQATEKRDLFYGLLGIVTDWCSKKPLRPNYSFSLRAAVTEAVFKCTSEQGGQEFLLGERFFRTLDPQNTPDMPSWVPDACFCSVQGQWVMVEQRRLRLYSSFTASGSRSQEASEFTIGKNETLFAQTLAVDKITRVGSVCDALENWVEAPDVFRQWMEMLQLEPRDWPEEPPKEGSLSDIFWRTIINNSIEADTESLSYREPTAEDYTQLRSLWFGLLDYSRLLKSLQLSFNLETLENLLAKVPKTVYHILVCLWQRRLFVTEGGMIGLAPRDVRVDDEVHVILGAPAPFFLRRIEQPAPVEDMTDLRPSYLVIGNGYVHDVMNGDALEKAGRGAVKTVAIH